MKRFARTITLAAAALFISGLAMAQDDPPVYAPPPINYGQSTELPNLPPPPPEPARLDFPTGIQVGPGTISPTIQPPGLQYTIHF